MTIEGDDNYPFMTYPEGDPYYDTHDECAECCEWYEIKIMEDLHNDDDARVCPDCFEKLGLSDAQFSEDEEEESDNEVFTTKEVSKVEATQIVRSK